MNTEGADVFMCRVAQDYGKMLLNLAYSRLGSREDAEDCVQEVFVTLLMKMPVFSNPDHEKAWLIRATINRAANMRKKTAGRFLPLEEIPEQAVPEQSVPEEPSLLSAIRALPDKYAAPIHLHYYEGYSLKEIAKLLGLPLPTVGTRLARGKAKLREMLKGEYDGLE